MVKIGIFDSGIGGLSVLKQLINLSSNVEWMYFADSEYMPYGNKGTNILKDRVSCILKFLKEEGCQIIIIACNTASHVWLDYLQNRSDNTVIILDAVTEVTNYLKSNYDNSIIGMLATDKTIESLIYERKLSHLNVKLISKSAGELAYLIENYYNSKGYYLKLNECVNYFKNTHIDILLLACTHYSFISDMVRRCQISDKTIVLDSSTIMANQIRNIIRLNSSLKKNDKIAKIEFFTSLIDPKFEKFKKMVSVPWCCDVPTTKLLRF